MTLCVANGEITTQYWLFDLDNLFIRTYSVVVQFRRTGKSQCFTLGSDEVSMYSQQYTSDVCIGRINYII